MQRPPSGEQEEFRVVIGVTLRYDNGPLHAQRVYTSENKMQRVLDYLRLIDPYGRPAVDPEFVAGSQFHIELAFSDGSRKIYRQKADRYMQIDGGDWQTINPARAEELSLLLGQMESDE
jgi:hypothetical protein